MIARFDFMAVTKSGFFWGDFVSCQVKPEDILLNRTWSKGWTGFSRAVFPFKCFQCEISARAKTRTKICFFNCQSQSQLGGSQGKRAFPQTEPGENVHDIGGTYKGPL